LRLYLDSSVFLHLFLDGKWADQAERILESVETGDTIGYVSILTVEEVAFKLLFAKASELGVVKYWEFRRKLVKDKAFREECSKVLLKFCEYLDRLSGLAWTHVAKEDYEKSLEIISRYGLLTADAIHAAIALRLGVPIATFDEDFKRVPGLVVVGLA